MRHARGAGRLAEDRDIVGIAAEGGDVALHPLQAGDLVEQAVVARGMLRQFGGERGMGEEAQHADAIVDRHHDHAALGQPRAVEGRTRGRAYLEAAAVDPHHDRQRALGVDRRPDVQGEAILAHRQIAAGIFEVDRLGRGAGLQALRAELRGGAHALPRRHRLRRLPAQVAERWRGEGNAEIGADMGVGRPFARDGAAIDLDRAAFDASLRPRAGACRKGDQQRCQETEHHTVHGFLLSVVSSLTDQAASFCTTPSRRACSAGSASSDLAVPSKATRPFTST